MDKDMALPKTVGIIDPKIIDLLNLTVSAGTPIVLGKSNYEHMKKSHPEDFKRYFPYLDDILANPDFVNLNPMDHSMKYLKKIDEYVTVGVRISNNGQFFARTIFVFPEWKFQQFMSGGYLVPYK